MLTNSQSWFSSLWFILKARSGSIKSLSLTLSWRYLRWCSSSMWPQDGSEDPYNTRPPSVETDTTLAQQRRHRTVSEGTWIAAQQCISILRLVYRSLECYAAALSLVYHRRSLPLEIWNAIINYYTLTKELALANMANVSPTTIVSLTNQQQKLWANQPTTQTERFCLLGEHNNKILQKSTSWNINTIKKKHTPPVGTF